MSLPFHETSKVEKFFAEAAPLLPAYRFQTVRYLAVKTDKGHLLLHLVVNLSARPLKTAPPTFQTSNVICAEITVVETGYEPRALIQALTSGKILLSGETYQFPADHAGNHSAHAWPYDGANAAPFEQAGRLMVQGDAQRYVHAQNQDYHREVKANRISYDHLPALGAAFGLEFQDHMNFCGDLYLSRVAEMADLNRATDNSATLSVWLAGALSPDEFVIALRTKASTRDRALPLDVSPETRWERDAQGDWRGTTEFTLPSSDRIVSAVASYAGLIQQERSYEPAPAKINSLRAAFAPFDIGDGALSTVLANRKIKDRDPKELERTVAAILAFRGFRVITADRIPGLQEVPDILAADAEGNILVVECTLNLPNSEQKLAKLHRRRQTIRTAFEESGLVATEVLGVLAVPQSADVLAPFQDEAGKHRLLLWNRDDLMRLAANDSPPNSEEIYDGVRQALAWVDLQRQFERSEPQ